MIRLTSAAQARALAPVLPAVAVERMVAFEGTDGKYNPEDHGLIVVLEKGDDLESVLPGVVQDMMDDDYVSPFEYVYFTLESGQRVFEATIPLAGDAMLVLIVPDAPWVESQLLAILNAMATQEGSIP